ncbi:uncharacterized protein J3R85_013813 [Psidium guajava]|nr:uncharacterized protein J3R85_013813 [Psidium guajava]
MSTLCFKPGSLQRFRRRIRAWCGNKVVGVKSGDSCFAIALQFRLTTEAFHFINPSLNCDALFIDQWLCIDGKATKAAKMFTLL